MTREEAIKYGTDWLKDEYLDAKDGAFITIALETLKQEPCEDAISRQAALELVANYDLSMGQVVEGIHALPLVNPKPKTGWIPVSERLPKTAFGCLVTVEEDDRNGEQQSVLYPDFVGYDGETWNDADGEPISFEVIAWQPLPEPYKAESEDKE